jgi:hypothetical protein
MRPDKAPLRKIVREVPRLCAPEFRRVVLECGHEAVIKLHASPVRTRCYDCLQIERVAWDDEHRCPHGVIEPNLKWSSVCKDCRIAELESEVERLQRLLLVQ